MNYECVYSIATHAAIYNKATPLSMTMTSSNLLQVNELLGAYRAIPTTPSTTPSLDIMKSIRRLHIPFTAVTCCQTNQQVETQTPMEADSPSPCRRPQKEAQSRTSPDALLQLKCAVPMQNASKCIHGWPQT